MRPEADQPGSGRRDVPWGDEDAWGLGSPAGVGVEYSRYSVWSGSRARASGGLSSAGSALSVSSPESWAGRAVPRLRRSDSLVAAGSFSPFSAFNGFSPLRPLSPLLPPLTSLANGGLANGRPALPPPRWDRSRRGVPAMQPGGRVGLGACRHGVGRRLASTLLLQGLSLGRVASAALPPHAPPFSGLLHTPPLPPPPAAALPPSKVWRCGPHSPVITVLHCQDLTSTLSYIMAPSPLPLII